MRRVPALVIYFCLIIINPSHGGENFTVTLRAPNSDNDNRHEWNRILTTIALEKTKEQFGAYQIQYAPVMSEARLWQSLGDGRYPNHLYSIPYRENLPTVGDVRYIEFPVEMGLLGYRICFYPEGRKKKIDAAVSSENIKSLTFGLGKGWADVHILRHNGFTVMEVQRYENLFKMTASGRFDLFCRGVSEI